MNNFLSFPNLNIDLFLIDPVAFNLFGRDVMWYGVIITFAIVLAVLYVMFRAKQEHLLTDDVYDYALIVVPTAILFARLYYVIFDPTPNYKTIIDVIAIWEGGLAIYGGIIGGALAVFCVCKWKKVYFARFADMICPAVMLGQAIGRWGNFMNAEAYGSVSKFDFFFVSFDISKLTAQSPFLMNVNGIDALPTFFFESIWNIVGFVLICTVINKHRKFAGANALFYFAWYGFGRMVIEGLRTDSLYIMGSQTLRVSQLIGGVTFILSVAAFVYMTIRAKKYPFDPRETVYYGTRYEKLKNEGFIVEEAEQNSHELIDDASDNNKNNDDLEKEE